VTCTGATIPAAEAAAGGARFAPPATRRYTPSVLQGGEELPLAMRVAVVAVPLLAAIVLHEVAHGAVAYLRGDPTAARLGRLTLNPLRHLDPVGSILVPAVLLLVPRLLGTPAFVFGWARPVPVDVRRLRHPRRDGILVALAGPAANLVLAAASALLLVRLPAGGAGSLLELLRHMAAASLAINCVLAVFNLLPVPPLDGGRVLTAFLPPRPARALAGLEGIGLVVVLLVVFNFDVLPALVRPVMQLLLGLAR
jgi:Zn-dependent protease